VEKFGNITLINGDCMDYMATLADKAYDLAIVDPPYGIGMGNKKTIGRRGKGKIKTVYKTGNWDIVPDVKYFHELQRVAKNYIIWGANYFSNLIDMSKMSWIVWSKNYINPNMTFGMGELAVYSGKYPLQIFECHHEGNSISNNERKAKACMKIHQCQKPVTLYKWLLKTYAKEGDKILDTHLGSGSICLAVHDWGDEMTGIELDVDNYNGAKNRLIQHQAQQRISF